MLGLCGVPRARTDASIVPTMSPVCAAKTAAEADLASEVKELDQLTNTKKELHSSCDWQMKNFDTRQKARDEEVDALGQAKSILKGAK